MMKPLNLILICVFTCMTLCSCSQPKTEESEANSTTSTLGTKKTRSASRVSTPTSQPTDNGIEEEIEDHNEVDMSEESVEAKFGAGFEDVEGLPEIPTLTGDITKDKAALVSALTQLQEAWTRNKNKQKMLEIRMKEKKDSDMLKAIRHANDGYQAYANKLQDMLEKVGR